MNNRAISLPDLASEKKRNTALSLSEGFAGASHQGAMAASTNTWIGRPAMNRKVVAAVKEANPNSLNRVLPLYYRCRQLALTTEKRGRRIPQKLASDMRALEKVVGKEIRNSHPLLFQRLDDHQLDRFLRAMAFLRLSVGRWLYGSENLKAEWPPIESQRSFLLLTGKINLYRDPNGFGDFIEIGPGSMFGEQPFRLADEEINDAIGGSAHCEEPCMVGIVTGDVLEACFADRVFGNRRIAQKIRHSVALARAVLPEPDPTKPRVDPESLSEAERAELFETCSSAVKTALDEMSRLVAVLHPKPGDEILTTDSLDESVFYVEEGSVEVRADATAKGGRFSQKGRSTRTQPAVAKGSTAKLTVVQLAITGMEVTLIERPESRPPKRTRLHVYIEKAEKLAGESIFDKLDPYCIVKLGEYKRFQTPVQWNMGVNPVFNYEGVLTFNGEEELTITVMDYDKFTSDDLCGNCTLLVDDLADGWRGKVELRRPKSAVGMMMKEDADLTEPAGKVFLSVKWDYETYNVMVAPKQRTWTDQALFTLQKNQVWGHERLMLGSVFAKALEGAAAALPYRLHLENFAMYAAEQKGVMDRIVVMKIANQRFLEFIKKSQREKAFVQACRAQALDTCQCRVLSGCNYRWENEEQNELLRKGILGSKGAPEEAVDPSKFRMAYKGVKATISIRNAANLSGGSWFDKLDPYAIVRFRGSREEVRTSVLADAGGDPIWDCEGKVTYNGEVALEVSVWDYDRWTADTLLATGVVQVEQFCSGFDGMIPLSVGGDKRKRTKKQAMITLGIMFDRPRDPWLIQPLPDQAQGGSNA
eukprot:s2122_g25.t3